MTEHNHLQLRQVLQLFSELSDAEHLSGQTIATHLDVSRSYVWKLIKQLLEFGVQVESRPGMGYYLKKPVSLLNADDMIKSLTAKGFGADISVELTTESTNKLLKQEFAHKKVILAEHQSAGRGRRGRAWVSPMASNIYLSLGWRSRTPIQQLGGLSLVIGLSFIRALEGCGVESLSLKWPNDIRVTGQDGKTRKLGGILIELSGDASGDLDCVIGVGINAHMPEQASEDIDQPWTDLGSVLGTVDRELVATQCVQSMLEYLQKFEQQGLTGFLDEWGQYDECFGQKVSIIQSATSTERLEGVGAGIDETGAFLLQTEQGVQPIYAGDVSLRFR